ncbi:MAG: nucleotide exchange factor GrpE [Isosphaeraceae bacterium]
MSETPTPDDPPTEGFEDVEAGPSEAVEVAYVMPAAVEFAVATVDEPVAALPAFDAPNGVDLTPVLDAVQGLGEAFGRRLDSLQSAFDREVRAEATREKIVDRLHDELQEYKQDLLLKVLRPVFIDLIQLHDDIGKMIDSQGGAEGDLARLLGLMRGIQQGIEDVLYRQGVEPFTEDGSTFDPRRQRAIETVPTDDPGLAKTVAARRRPGFQVDGRVIRPELVSVHAARRP